MTSNTTAGDTADTLRVRELEWAIRQALNAMMVSDGAGGIICTNCFAEGTCFEVKHGIACPANHLLGVLPAKKLQPLYVDQDRDAWE